MREIIVVGGFDDLRSRQVRFLEEASRLGRVHVLLWPDETARVAEGKAPKFPFEERLYLLRSIRYVDRVTLSPAHADCDTLPPIDGPRPDIWVFQPGADTPARRAWCENHGVECRTLRNEDLQGLPEIPPLLNEPASRKKVVVTGCYDWFHSGHVRFFEEVAGLGDLYAIVGHDGNIRLLKGEGHPMFTDHERWYMVQAVRHVKQALISTGDGWMDGEPEFLRIRPDIYAVNEDGDRPEKREFCDKHGIEYRVLKRLPKEGLPRRQSTDLRGF
ncbi:MAG TPA: adenylyltransferase/cytidyltransferase family protein [Phycisphaerae bacterium]|nr:adenylyltransferase/cytidyltransferase family protein [Phycisphaerae bacterium]